MDVQKKLDEIVATVGGARSVPMSASCVINRDELLAALEEVRRALPGSLAQAREVIGGREQLVEEARREAQRIIESAHSRRGSLVSGTEVARRSRAEADRILEEARREAEEIRAEADDYVDSKLANFEVVLTKTIGSVDRGREKLLGRGPALDEQGRPDQEAPERSHDPETRRLQADAYVDTKLATFEAVLSKTLEAVGRGRRKLLGRVPADDLGAHIAAQDAAGAPPSARPASDAEFLAGLAGLAGPAGPAAPQPPAPERPEPAYGVYAHPQQAPYGYQDPYGPGQPPQPDPYTGAGPGPAAVGHPAHHGTPQPEQRDPYGAYGQPYTPQPPPPALDETSFFDTGMIDLDRLRRYEEGR